MPWKDLSSNLLLWDLSICACVNPKVVLSLERSGVLFMIMCQGIAFVPVDHVRCLEYVSPKLRRKFGGYL
jgi:hypothetical protein